MNWEVIKWTCFTIAALILILVIFYYVWSARLMKKKRMEIVSINDNLKVGVRVMFAGMLGKVVKIEEEYIDVEIAKGTVVTVSRYAVSDVITGKKGKA